MGKKPKMGNAVEVANPDELVTVRHSLTGLYLAVGQKDMLITARQSEVPELPYELVWLWGPQEDCSVLPRAVAVQAAATYNALVPESDLELEPVVEEVL